ncbi:hypothetical protein CXF85_04465 [Colwellia sp. 75C3]|uniref:NRDE family protein n=1 Tax=Colwellia sp. 75C3 TaxID=888425 RepID=UPI000C320CEC|nr:NRDE family protein [Colwellia sp. 75C3]PKG86030.1 hypothetical protein CXF85_04465 [Colwellia sp. 75C3]
MCTLTYLLNDNGYELFFNRDEQRSRALATPPTINQTSNAIYPIDPQGQGTWIAVTKKGLSLALLNYYQGSFNDNKSIVSRGELILSLLRLDGDIIKQFQMMDLRVYQPFQLCIFPEDLSIKNQRVQSFKWTGNELNLSEADLPITSSSVDFIDVSQKRKHRFNNIVDKNMPLSIQHKGFHFSTEAIGKYSVNMQRGDAKTVSISHISVNNTISFNYFDNVLLKDHDTTFLKE